MIAFWAMLAATGSAQAVTRPNIIVIQTDDQNSRTVEERFRKVGGGQALLMPNTFKGIFRGGTEFRNFYATSPVCSPSRASLLTGKYPRNAGVIRNQGPAEGWQGGWRGWQESPSYEDNLATTLQQAGYQTSHIGKFMNGYFDTVKNSVETTVPPGWDYWFTESMFNRNLFYGYQVNQNGLARIGFGNPLYLPGYGLDPKRCDAATLIRLRLSNGCNYATDVITREAVKQIRQRSGQPFYLQVDFAAPHEDARPPAGPEPATRHSGSLAKTWLSRTPNFNEENISDKSPSVRERIPSRLNSSGIKKLRDSYRRYAASLRGVDDGVGAIMKALREKRQLGNTYIFFLSDHGFYLGEHRLSRGKFLPYDASARVAMAVRGPDVPAGGMVRQRVGNIDIAPTALELAGLIPDEAIDGRPLRPLWLNPSATSRRPVGLTLASARPEAAQASAGISVLAPFLAFEGFMVGPYKYFRFDSGGEAELYDMKRDPWELRNVIDSPGYIQVRQYMEAWLPRVAGCAGPDCRADLPPWPEPAPGSLPFEP